MNSLEKLYAACAAYQQAGEALSAATQRAFPVGARIAVNIGKLRITGVVESAGGSWWYHPDGVALRNEKTGKGRHFQASYRNANPVILDAIP